MPGILAEIAGRIATFLAFDGDDFRNVLCDIAGHLQIDVLESALPSGAATAANQATIITAVQSLQNLVGALHDVGIDELDVIVESSALPTGAATETTVGLVKDRIGALSGPAGGSTNKLLTDALTALQLIDDLYGALHSQNTDELVVRGEDQLLSYKAPLADSRGTVVSEAGGFVDSDTPTDGDVWIVTNIVAYNVNSATTRHGYMDRRGGGDVYFYDQVQTFAAWDFSHWRGHLYLEHDDVVRVTFTGALATDSAYVELTGYIMSKE